MTDSAPHPRAKLRRLLPRSTVVEPVVEARQVKTQFKLSRNVYTGCYVSSCLTQNCSSYVHQQLPWLARSGNIGVDDLFEQIKSLVKPDHCLALPTAVSNDTEFKDLFHQYLTYDMPRIVALMAPPSSTQSPGQFIVSRTKAIAELGSSAQVYFLLFVSMAHILELVRREQLQAERVSAKLYCRLSRFLRQKLEVYQPSEASSLILAILAMSSFDMSLGNREAVCCHRAALAQLVSQVGLPYLGYSTSLVLSYDRLMSAYTTKPPLYAKMPNRTLLRERAQTMKYGSALMNLEQTLAFDNDVQTVCLDLCTAVEIVESENWTFRPERQYRPYNVSEIQYLYFLREVIQNSCISLHARDLRNSQVSKAVLLAVMIMQYIVLGKNELTWYTTTAARRLYHALSTPDIDEIWRGHESLLCWLMCVLVLVPKPWKQRAEALNWFAVWLETRFYLGREKIDRNTIESVCDLRSFIWCRPELDDMLDVALNDIRSGNIFHVNDRSFTPRRHNSNLTADQSTGSLELSDNSINS